MIAPLCSLLLIAAWSVWLSDFAAYAGWRFDGWQFWTFIMPLSFAGGWYALDIVNALLKRAKP